MTLDTLLSMYTEIFAPRFPGFQCGEGWSDLIDRSFDELRRRRPDARIVQAKEKYGGLRIYLDDKLDEEATAILRRAEQESFGICEMCGAPRVLRRDPGCLATLCDEHWRG